MSGRSTTRRSRTTRRSSTSPASALAAVIALALGAAGVAVTAQGAAAATAASPTPAAGPQQYTDQVFPAAGTPAANEQTSPTEDKPQSKLWRSQGSWWALMRSASGPVTVHHLVDHAWVDTRTVVDPRATSTADALAVGTSVYVASRTIDGGVLVSRLGYASGGYTVVEGPTQVVGGGTESVTIARDSTDRLWVTYTQGSAVWVARTTSASTASWAAPFLVPGADTSVGADDISAITSFDGHIGVLWSDQVDQVVRFAVHDDDDPDSTWTTQTPLAGRRVADDHLNLKTVSDDDGRVFAAVKTSLGDDPSDPRTAAGILVLTRGTGGTWTSTPATTVADRLTRPQLVLDPGHGRMHLFMTTEAGGTVYEKTSPISSPSFPGGPGTPLVAAAGALINNVTTSKDPASSATGVVVLASDEKATLRYYHAEIPLADVVPLPARLQGADRYATAAAISAAAFPGGAGTAVVASGEAFPDALSAAPLAHALGGPVLLVAQDAVPAAVTAELARLGARRVVVVGGTAAVSAGVQATLTSSIGDVERVQGVDRYGTSQAVAAAVLTAEGVSSPVPEVVVASGEAFPDALAGGAYAAAKGAPLLLTAAGSVPAATSAALGSLRPGALTLLGGTAAVGTGVEAQLAATAPVTRWQGVDRYGTAAAVSEHLAPSAGTVLIANGNDFPDAVAGAALGRPLELTTPPCLPAPTVDSLARLGGPRLVALGGTVAVSDAAAGGAAC